MKKNNLFFGILAIMLVFTMTAVGCNNDPADNNTVVDNTPKPITFKSTDTAGNTYTLIITPGAANTVAAGDSYELTITKTGQPDKVSKGTITNITSDNKLTMKPTNSEETFTVTANDSGQMTNITGNIAVEGSEDSVTAPGTLTPVVTFNSVTANGSAAQTTTQLTLAFSQAVTGLSAADITLSGVSGVIKGALSGSGPSYTLPISGFTAGGTVTVAVAKAGYAISGSPKTATVYYYSGGGSTELNGAWYKDGYQLAFDGNNWSYLNTSTGTGSQGTVSVDTTTKKVTFTVVYSGGTSTTNANYAVSGNTLVISNNTNNSFFPINGTWTKQETKTFDSIEAMAAWLSAQPANVAAAAYTVTLNVSDLGGSYNTAGSAGKALTDNSTKYVNLNLSGSTFTSIEQQAFSGCTSLASITIPNSVTTIGGGYSNLGGTLGAFYYCTSLASITIPNSVTTIEYGAFASCKSLTSVTIGNGVTSIGNSVFSECTSLTAITVDAGNTAYSSADGVLYDKDKTTLTTYPEGKTGNTFTIPNGVTSIGPSAFYRSGLTGVTIPATLTQHPILRLFHRYITVSTKKVNKTYIIC